MSKTRVDGSAVVWTDPTGRCWTSPAQHPAPAAVRLQPRTAVDEPDLSPQALAELLAGPDADTRQDEPRAVAAPADTDRIGDAIRDDDGWGLALDDPYRWSA